MHKYFIRQKLIKIIRPLLIKLPKMRGYFNKIEKTQYMSFVIKDEQLLKKYKLIWNKISNIVRKKIDKQLVYGGNYLNTKQKSNNVKINTDFLGKKPLKKAAKILDSVFKIENKDDKYYPQIYLEECGYEKKKRKKGPITLKKKTLILSSNKNGESDDEFIE